MNIETGSDYSNPIDVGCNIVTKTWASFIKIHLRAQHKDGFAVLKGECTFVLEMEVKAIGIRAHHHNTEPLPTH